MLFITEGASACIMERLHAVQTSGGSPSKSHSSPNLRGLTKFGRVKNFLDSPVPIARRVRPEEGERRKLLAELHASPTAECRVRLLSERGLDAHSLLHEAVLSKDLALVAGLLAEEEIDINVRDTEEATPLHWLCWFCDDADALEPIKVLELLLEHQDLLIDARDNRGFTPLMLATDQCNEAFVSALLEAGADADARAESGTNALLIATFHGSAPLAEELAQAGCNVDVQGPDGMTPLMMAAQKDDMNLAVLLVKAGALVELATSAGTARELARSDVVRQFLTDSAFYQSHAKRKKQQQYARMVEANRTKLTRSLTPTHSVSSLHRSSSRLHASAITFESSQSKPSPNAPPGLRVLTSENSPLDLDYFTHPVLGKAQLGMCMCPGRNKPKKTHIWRRDLQTDLQVIKDSGCDIVVSLVRSKELLSMGIMELFVRLRQMGMESLHFPVPDKWIPESMGEVTTLVTTLVQHVRQGRKITIHCNGGKGRTGMVVVATLVAMGMSVEPSINAVRARRSGMIRNPAQIMYLRWFSQVWRHEHPEYAAWKAEGNEKELQYELLHERKHSKHPDLVATVSVQVVGLKDVKAAACSFLTCSLLAVSGPHARNRLPFTISEDESENLIQFVVANCNSWHCLLGLVRPDGGSVGTVVVCGATEQRKQAYPIVTDDGTIAGFVQCVSSIDT